MASVPFDNLPLEETLKIELCMTLREVEKLYQGSKDRRNELIELARWMSTRVVLDFLRSATFPLAC